MADADLKQAMAQLIEGIRPDGTFALGTANLVAVLVLAILQKDAALTVAIPRREITVLRLGAVDVLAETKVDQAVIVEMLGGGDQIVTGLFDPRPVLQQRDRLLTRDARSAFPWRGSGYHVCLS